MSDACAADVFELDLVDRKEGLLKRAALWGGTLVAGVTGAEDMAPAMSELVIRKDGRELRRITASDVGALLNLRDRILLELESSTPEDFATSWGLDLRS